VNKRSVRIAGHNTSITLEDEFWTAIKDIAHDRKLSVNQLILEIDEKREGNLSSALRLYVLQYLQDRLSKQ